MKRDEILKKAQKAKKDEREQSIYKNAYYIGAVVVGIIMLILIAMKHYFNDSITDITIILVAHATGGSFYQYFKLREKKIYLITGIMGIIGIILGFATLLSEYGVY